MQTPPREKRPLRGRRKLYKACWSVFTSIGRQVEIGAGPLVIVPSASLSGCLLGLLVMNRRGCLHGLLDFSRFVFKFLFIQGLRALSIRSCGRRCIALHRGLIIPPSGVGSGGGSPRKVEKLVPEEAGRSMLRLGRCVQLESEGVN